MTPEAAKILIDGLVSLMVTGFSLYWVTLIVRWIIK